MSDRMAALSGQALAILLALTLGALVILAIDENPLVVLDTLLRGAFGSPERIAGTLLQATPILVCGIAACISLRGGRRAAFMRATNARPCSTGSAARATASRC